MIQGQSGLNLSNSLTPAERAAKLRRSNVEGEGDLTQLPENFRPKELKESEKARIRRGTVQIQNLDDAVQALRIFHSENQKRPTYADARKLGLGKMLKEIGIGKLKFDGIRSWRDLLRRAGMEVDKPMWDGSRKEIDAIAGKMVDFYRQEGRMPSLAEVEKDLGFRGLGYALRKGKFEEFDISNWGTLKDYAKILAGQ